jgi:hypothetical protein
METANVAPIAGHTIYERSIDLADLIFGLGETANGIVGAKGAVPCVSVGKN